MMRLRKELLMTRRKIVRCCHDSAAAEGTDADSDSDSVCGRGGIGE